LLIVPPAGKKLSKKVNMKNKYSFLSALVLMLFFASPVAYSQNKNSEKNQVETTDKNPASFLISKTDLNALLGMKVNEVIRNKNNRFLDGGIIMANTKNGDMQFVKVRLSYFRKAFLNIQVNGADSTQVFVLSEDQSVSYKGSIESENIVMLKCDEDEIISE
jgi:hypothetical protein